MWITCEETVGVCLSDLKWLAKLRLVGEISQVRHGLFAQDRHVERPFVTGGTHFCHFYPALNTVLWFRPFSSLINECAKNFRFETSLEA